MGKIIILISSKGGCGKSTVAVGMAAAFSFAGKTSLLIDADEGARCLDTLLAVNDKTVFDISDILDSNADEGDAVIKVPYFDGVSVIPSPFGFDPLDFEDLAEYLEKVSAGYDFVIVDTKGQIPAERISLLPHDAQFVSVVTADPIAVKNTGSLIGGLEKYGISCRLIINRFKKRTADGSVSNIDGIVDACGARLIGVIPEDKRLGRKGYRPMVFGTAAAAVARISARLAGTDIPLPAVNKII